MNSLLKLTPAEFCAATNACSDGREVVELRAEYERLREERDEALSELAAARARLDSGQILLTVAGERVWHSGVDLRAAIDAAREEAK